MKQTARLYAVSDEGYAVQRFYTGKLCDFGFKVAYRLDEDGEKATYIDDFDFKDLPKLIEALDEEIIVSKTDDEYELTIYDLPFSQEEE